ncbi:protease Do [Leptothrix cholodnii SP-6]|uniref:Probable periplasmic serine endoprotease DegP-like n=1 Tax=Leptothrix cholodnii (strain ATCC 51168 / LMG 8142 / SP-6) TaxID=395495 RepID=B1XZN1_LEPCP|nr:DegQ family serine endoprotease [Leptothrix cholodnii]ACB32877.1 protease Do [Leptothrix cholodnii SP-6]
MSEHSSRTSVHKRSDSTPRSVAALRWLAPLLTAACLLPTPALAQSGGAQAAAAQAGAAAPLVRGLPDFTELVEQVGPAVVNIRTTAKARTARSDNPADEEMQEFFRRFFGVPIPRQGPRQGPPGQGQSEEEAVPRGVGSGFIVSSDGFVMTNAHVVEGADEVTVRLTDKREFKARVVGADKRTDIAVLKLDATGLPAVRLGDVSRLKVGEWVIAIGSPFDLDNTVTAGIVSAKARDTGDLVPFIQTDVAINPGNSGGPLINLRGEVVGVNSQIYSRSGGYMGISFAIPIDEASRVADQLRTSGRVVRGRIGVQIGEVTKDVAESLGLGKAAGALVRSVEDGSPAGKAGLEAGDIVTRFDGKPVEKWNDLPRLVGKTAPGTKTTIQVFRRGSMRDLSVTVAELEAEAAARPASTEPAPAKPAAPATVSLLGLTVSDLSAKQREELKVKGGVRVDAVDGAGGRAGLREGDIILAVANTEITNLRQFEAVVGKLDKSKPVNLLFRRGEWAQYAVIRPGK